MKRFSSWVIVALLIASAQLCFAQNNKKGSVYLIIEIKIKNKKLYSKYVEKVPKIIERYGGRYLIRGGKVTSLSGNWNPERIIVIEFKTVEQLHKCFKSTEYLELAPLREQSATGKAIIVEGCLPLD